MVQVRRRRLAIVHFFKNPTACRLRGYGRAVGAKKKREKKRRCGGAAWPSCIGLCGAGGMTGGGQSAGGMAGSSKPAGGMAGGGKPAGGMVGSSKPAGGMVGAADFNHGMYRATFLKTGCPSRQGTLERCPTAG